MGASAGKPPSAPDPTQILGLQNQYNRSNSVGPFGSQSWSSGGPGGHETLTTSISPQMQGAVDRAFSAASTPYQKEYVPQGMDQLASALLGRVGSHYGLQGQGLNTNLQQQKPSAGMSPQAPQGMGPGSMPGLNGMQGGIPGNQQLMAAQQAGGQSSGPGLGGLSQGMAGNPFGGFFGNQSGGLMGPPAGAPPGMPSGLNFNQPGQQQTQFMPNQVI